MKIARKPRNDKQFFLIQNQETIDALQNWILRRAETMIDGDGTDGEYTIGDLYFINTNMQIDDQTELDVNGLPRVDLTERELLFLMPRDIQFNMRMLTDGRAVINKDAIHPWLHILKRPRAKGGLKVAKQPSGFRDVAWGSDIVPLNGTYYNAVIAMLVPDPPTE
jgi:hypothetical protein